MKTMLTDKDYFEFLTNRNKEIILETIDKNIRDVIVSLNNIPGIATAFSCEGHQVGRRSDRLYITMGLTEEGLNNLSIVLSKLTDELKKVNGLLIFLPELEYSLLTRQSDKNTFDISSTWNSWTLSAFLNKKEKQVFLTALTAALA